MSVKVTSSPFKLRRDPLGLKPVYYALQKSRLYHSSNLAELIQHPDIKAKINSDWVIRFLNEWEEQESETSYQNIFSLPPAHELEFRDGKLKIQRYWQMNKKSYLTLSMDEAISKFRVEIESAVEKCLPKNNAPLAFELSGGIDSSSITAIAASKRNQIFAYTHAAESGNDERKLINEFLKVHPNINHNLITKENCQLGDEIRWATRTLGQPPRSSVNEFATQLYENVVKSGAKILFSGFGGDEGVSQRSITCAINEMISNRQWQYLIREAKSRRAETWVYSLLGMIYRHFFSIKPWPVDYTIDRFFLKTQYRLKYYKDGEVVPKDNTFNYTKHLLPNRRHTAHRLEESYQLAKHFELEYRYPLLDLELLDFYHSIPPQYKVFQNQNRYLFRNDLMKDLLPKVIRENHDKTIGGGTIPGIAENYSSFRNELNNLNLDFLDENYLAKVIDDADLPFPYEKVVACDELYKMHIKQNA